MIGFDNWQAPGWRLAEHRQRYRNGLPGIPPRRVLVAYALTAPTLSCGAPVAGSSCGAVLPLI
ncbi:MAG: hypothetical protein ACRDRS_26940, partial [Pseudonocardiaceae bacterium]